MRLDGQSERQRYRHDFRMHFRQRVAAVTQSRRPLIASSQHAQQQPAVSDDVTAAERSDTFMRTFVRYTEELEDYISKHRAPPPDIRYWPYGPYWPSRAGSEGPVIGTPKHVRQLPGYKEPLWHRLHDGRERLGHRLHDGMERLGHRPKDGRDLLCDRLHDGGELCTLIMR